jgi:RNA polymerase sigma-70 factor, ECF subfamily
MKVTGNRKPKMTDEELMLLVRKGDQEALAILYDRYSGAMVNFFYRMLNRDLQKAQDFMHDLFIKLIENPFSFDCNRKFDTWIFSLAYNQCKNEYRKLAVREGYSQAMNIVVEDAMIEPDETYDIRAFEVRLNEVLESMGEKHKSVFLMRYQQGLSLREIADITGCPEGTVKSRLFNATRELAESLKIYDPRKN